jgi:hypothetical protein
MMRRGERSGKMQWLGEPAKMVQKSAVGWFHHRKSVAKFFEMIFTAR